MGRLKQQKECIDDFPVFAFSLLSIIKNTISLRLFVCNKSKV